MKGMRASAIKKPKKKRKQRARIAAVQKAVLYSLAAAGGLAMAVVAPAALQVLEQFGWIQTKRSFKATVNRSVERLLQAKLVEKDERGFIQLTSRGRERLTEIERADYELPKPKRWDGKWRIVSFDIKEKRKRVRELLRQTLEAVGFVLLHKSVWVYPHDCEDFLSLLKADYRSGVEILYIVAEYIENDGWLRRHFDLPPV